MCHFHPDRTKKKEMKKGAATLLKCKRWNLYIVELIAIEASAAPSRLPSGCIHFEKKNWMMKMSVKQIVCCSQIDGFVFD
jgi:hypothetical protein